MKIGVFYALWHAYTILPEDGGTGMDAFIQNIISNVKMIRITDIVDIAIMSVLIYKLI